MGGLPSPGGGEQGSRKDQSSVLDEVEELARHVGGDVRQAGGMSSDMGSGLQVHIGGLLAPRWI